MNRKRSYDKIDFDSLDREHALKLKEQILAELNDVKDKILEMQREKRETGVYGDQERYNRLDHVKRLKQRQIQRLQRIAGKSKKGKDFGNIFVDICREEMVEEDFQYFFKKTKERVSTL